MNAWNSPQQGLATANNGNPGEPDDGHDAVDAYFECITTCSLDDSECITVCTTTLRDHS
jgi:hypothetical protein